MGSSTTGTRDGRHFGSNRHVVTLSSSLPLAPVGPYSHTDDEPVGVVFGRSVRDWHEGVLAYCDRQVQKLPRGERRFSLDALHFNTIGYTMRSVRYADPEAERVHLMPPVLEHEKVPALLPHEATYQTWKRRDLALHLVNESSKYSDAKLLSHLSTNKLARMLAEVRLANVKAARA